MSDSERPPDPATKHEASVSEETTEKSRPPGYDAGRSIGEYVLIRRIGGGGMGVVYEAEHARLKRRVAVKVISESYLQKSSSARRFFREMEAAGRLEHPHIVRATDAGVADGVAYLVMEYVAGADLARVVRQFGPLPPLAALEAIEQAAQAIAHIHEHRMVHRDIKPSNLLLSQRGEIKLADLGLAHLATESANEEEMTATGDIVGTVEYMAPEQARDSKLIDHRADIYSLGCCMHFLFAGLPVFRTDSRVDCLIAHRTEEVPDLVGCYGFPLPRSLNRLFQDTLAKNPDHRPQTVGDVLRRLQRCRDELRELVASSAREKTVTIGGKALPIDAGLEATASTLLGTETAVLEHGSLHTTVQLHRGWGSSAFRPVAIAACLAVAVLGVSAGTLYLRSMSGAKQSPPNRAGEADAKVAAASPPAEPEQFVLEAHPGGAVFNVRFAHDGRHLLSCGSDGKVRVWDMQSRKRLADLPHERGPNGLHVIDVGLVPDSPYAVSACYNGIATVWNWQTGERLRQFDVHQNQVEGVAWISGTRVLTTGRDDAMYVWDVRSGEVLARLDNSHSGGVRAVAVHPDGRRVVTADYAGGMLLWSVADHKAELIRSLEPVHEAIEIWSMDWVGDTSRVAIGGVYASGKPLLIVYDIESGEVTREFRELTGRVYGVRASRDDRHLFAAADNVYGWSLDSPEDKPLFEFTRHNDNVFSVDESPDGTLLATGGTDGTVRIFKWREAGALP